MRRTAVFLCIGVLAIAALVGAVAYRPVILVLTLPIAAGVWTRIATAPVSVIRPILLALFSSRRLPRASLPTALS